MVQTKDTGPPAPRREPGCPPGGPQPGGDCPVPHVASQPSQPSAWRPGTPSSSALRPPQPLLEPRVYTFEGLQGTSRSESPPGQSPAPMVWSPAVVNKFTAQWHQAHSFTELCNPHHHLVPELVEPTPPLPQKETPYLLGSHSPRLPPTRSPWLPLISFPVAVAGFVERGSHNPWPFVAGSFP